MLSVIFCGGFGTRMNNGEPGLLKPLIQVAGKEILRHVMSIYEYYGVNRFLLLGGYRINDLREFAEKYATEGLSIQVADTGEGTPTGGRLLLVKDIIGDEDFLLTYGDSLTNYNLNDCLTFKKNANTDLVVSTYHKFLEYGILDINENDRLLNIHEKTFSVPINAGFYVLNKRIFSYFRSVEESFEIDILPRILREQQLSVGAFEVKFWHPMDTPEDQKKLGKILLDKPQILFT